MTTSEGEIEVIQEEVADVEAEVAEHDDATTEEKDSTDWKQKHDELAARLQRAEKKLDKQKVEQKVEKKVGEILQAGDLDETQLDYLDLKGISDEDDIEVIHKVMQRTGLTLRQALKDDYVTSKLEKNKKEREVKEATPSGTRRATNQANDVDLWAAKYEQTGELPTDFKLRSEVINRRIAKEDTNKPSWRK